MWARKFTAPVNRFGCREPGPPGRRPCKRVSFTRAEFHLVQPSGRYPVCNGRDSWSETANRSYECKWKDHQRDAASPGTDFHPIAGRILTGQLFDRSGIRASSGRQALAVLLRRCGQKRRPRNGTSALRALIMAPLGAFTLLHRARQRRRSRRLRHNVQVPEGCPAGRD